MASTVSYVGLGNMGRGMASNLATKGPLTKPLRLYNRTYDRASELAASLPSGSAVAVSNLAEAVIDVDVVFLCLSTDDVVTEMIDLLLKVGDVKGKTVVNCSTVSPETSVKVTQMVESQGADYVACPVFGTSNVAAAGQLVVACAGPALAVSRILPFLTGVTARQTINLSDEQPAKASLLKSISNTFVVNMIEATAEAMVLADKSGLGTKYMQDLAKVLWPGPSAFYAERMGSGLYADGQVLSSAESGVQQSRALLDMANSAGAKISATEIALSHLKRVTEVMGKQGDVAGIYGAVREESGLTFKPSVE